MCCENGGFEGEGGYVMRGEKRGDTGVGGDAGGGDVLECFVVTA